jgi:tripartite-type tricarboxylate transporter receptor subunit TctC
VPGYEVMSFNGIGAPRATPRPVVMRVNREIRAVVEEPDIRKRLVEQGNEVRPTTPEEFTNKVATEIAKWREIVTSRGIDVE